MKFVPQSILLYGFAENGTSKNVPKTSSCTLPSIWPTSFRKLCKICFKNHAFSCLDFHAKVCCCTDPYSTTCSSKYNSSTQNRKCLLGICALALLGNVPTCCSLSSPNSPQKSPTLFFSCLAHYPMHSFINSEDDLLPPKCFITFPNHKSKGQDLIFPLQDQGP
jgi:hypothetical protein